MRLPLLAKAVSLAVIVVVLLAALARIGWLVDERRAYQADAERSVSQSLAGPLLVLGPFLHRACTEQWDVVSEKMGERTTTTERRAFTLTAVPNRVAVSGDLTLEPLYRGLFKVNTFGGKLSVAAEWPQAVSMAPQRTRPGSRLQCDAPSLALALDDPRGIRNAALTIDGAARPLQAGTAHEPLARGFHAALAPSEWRDKDDTVQPLAAQLQIDIVGTTAWAWVPAAGQTEVALRSNWPHPSFGGRFAPAERRVESQGFAATWRVSGLATDAAASLARGGKLCGSAYSSHNGECLDTLAVSFIDPVNIYVLSDRAIKYGLLFIVVTLGAVLLVESLARRPVHPIQYLLVGAALTLFFLLVLSLSEHLPFWQAYATAAAACVLLLAYYGAHLLGGAKRGLAFGSGVAGLYGAMYLLLQMEQTALVVGSSMLFALLAAVMVATRHVDWFALFTGMRQRVVTPAAAAPAGVTDAPAA
jgi:inner membrane protein